MERCLCHTHCTNKEAGSESLSNVPKVTIVSTGPGLEHETLLTPELPVRSGTCAATKDKYFSKSQEVNKKSSYGLPG